MKKLNQITGMPQMRAAFSGWTTNITLQVIVNNISSDGFNVPVEVDFNFKGTVQPLSVEQLEMKPEAQRAFEWLQIHIMLSNSPSYRDLKVGDEIIYNSRTYRINGKKDYSLNNYVEYHAMEVTQ